MYIVFIIILAITLLITYIIFNSDVLCPSVVCVGVFLLCACIGLTRWSDWRIYEYSADAVTLLSFGIGAFVLGGAFAYVKSRKRIKDILPIRRERIEVSNVYIIIGLIIGIIGNLIFFVYIKGVASAFSLSTDTFSDIIQGYHTTSGNIRNAGRYASYSIVTYIRYIILVEAPFCLFILIHNICFRVYKKRDLWIALILALSVINSLLNSNRGDLLILAGEGIYFLWFFWNMYFGWKRTNKKKIIKYGIRIFIGLLVVFVVLAVLLGRKNSFSDFDVWDYLSVYISGGIRNFDLYVKDPVKNAIWGKETFTSINRFLYLRFNIGELYYSPLEFRNISGENIGNIYTSFRRYLSDFGISGMIIISLILGYLYSKCYYRVKNNSYENKITFLTLLFPYLAKGIFYLPIDETVLTFEMSLNGLGRLLFLYLLYYFLIKKKLRFR